MKKIKVIPNKIMPTRLPIWPTCVVYLLMDKFNAVGWVWGAVGVLWLIVWIVAIARLLNEQEIDLDKGL